MSVPRESRFLRHGLPWLIVLAQLAWWSYGTWPVVPVEGDEQGVLFGVEGLVQADAAKSQLRYSYAVQPGAYPVLATLVRLTHASPEKIYGFATIAGALFFVAASVQLLRRVIPWPAGWLCVALLCCQEVGTAACYMNTSSLAGGFVILGLVMSAQPGRLAWLWAGLLLAAGGWLRADSLLVAPACLGLAYWERREWRAAVGRTAAIAVVAVVAFITLYRLSGTSVLNGVEEFEERGFFFSSLRALLEAPFQVFSPALAIAALVGLVWLVIRREWPLLFLVASGCLPTLLAHGSSFSTPKYLYYLIPLGLLPALWTLDRLKSALPAWPQPRARLAVAGFGVMVFADNFIGLRTLSAGQRLFEAPTVASLAGFDLGRRRCEFVIGPGELVANVDGFRVRTGQIFAPARWHVEKERMRANLFTVASWLARDEPVTLCWTGWLALQMAVRQLFAAGFRPDPVPPDGDRLAPVTWRRAEQVVYLRFLGYPGSRFQPPGLAPASPTGTTYLVGDVAHQTPTELSDHARWKLVSERADGLIMLYERN